MKQRSLSLSSIFLLALSTLFSCEQNNDLTPEISSSASARVGQDACSALEYSESVFYYNEQIPVNTVSPRKSRTGTYGSFPDGLSINSSTGAIDVNKSESGLKYRVWYTAKNSKDTCNTYVTISGINYPSRVYNLDSGNEVAEPFYNGQANLKANAEGDFDNDGDVKVMQLVDDRLKKPKGVVINKATGAINLRKSVENGLFGKNPTNGTVKMFRILYRLNDASKKSLNYIDVRLHYYAKQNAVPSATLAKAEVKTFATFRQATPAISTNMMYSTNEEFVEDSRKPRPPDIIIVGH